MRDFQYSRSLRIISTVVLSFFIWTFGGVFDIAYAVKSDQQAALSGQQRQKTITPPGLPLSQGEGKRPEERFQKTVEDIENILKDEKADHETKRQRLRTRKADIDQDDIEIKKQFKDTEEKIKDLPEVIKLRHRDFVKKYEDNLREFKANLEDIDKAKTDAEKEQASEKTLAFLEKVKAPKKHQKLDPNKLPHRSAEPVWTEPRTKPEEFTDGKELRANGKMQQPILVASNGSLAGLLASDSKLNSPSSMQLALATPPSAADLAETIEVKFTPAITAKAAELGNKPLKIYEWVRNNIEFVPTYGSIQGADMCLQTKQCNDFDTASLLIALLRVSGIHAKYVYGTIELPIEKVKNWVGGFTDTNSAMTLIASGGIPLKGLTEGGQITAAQMEHIWIEAWVDMIPSMGAVHKHGDTWVSLDASYKQYAYTAGTDLYESLSFSGEQFLNSYITDTQDITAYQFYSQQMFTWLDANIPNATNADVFGADDIDLSKVIVEQNFPILLGTLPYKAIAVGAKYSELTDNLRHKITIALSGDMLDGGSTTVTKYLSEMAGKRLTLSYASATSSDEALITQYGGNMLNVPPYLLKMKPVIKIEGVDILTGNSIGMGNSQNFSMSFSGPNSRTDVVQNYVIAGTYSAITIQSQKTPVELVAARMQKLRGNSKNVNAVTLDDLLGELLYTIGLSYFHHLTFENDLYSKTFQMVYTKKMSEAITTLSLNVSYLYGIPYSVSQSEFNIDVDINVTVSQSLAGDSSRLKQFLLISGITSSAWENRIFEVFFDTPSASAIKLLKYAKQQGVPVYTIDNSNINQLLPALSISSDVKADIQNAVNVGNKVMVSQTELQYNEWSGVGYIILDPVTGAGAYMISGGLAGGGTTNVLTTPPIVVMKNSFDYYRFKTLFFNNVLNTSVSLMGTRYRWGGTDPEFGVDCSGFTQYVLNTAGFNVPRTAGTQYIFYRDNSLLFDKPEEGDQFFWKKSDGRIYHTGFVVGVAGSFVSIIHAVEQATSGRYVNKVDSDFYDTESDSKWQSRIASPGFGRPIN